MNVVVHRLKRVVEIWKLLNHQVDVLETMTPLDFSEFRRAAPRSVRDSRASSFREDRSVVRLAMENRFSARTITSTPIWAALTRRILPRSAEFEKRPSILQLVENWLERMPFFNEEFWRDWEEAREKGEATAFRLSGPVTALFTSKVSPTRRQNRPPWQVRRHLFQSRWGAFRRPLCALASSLCSIATSRCSVFLSRF
jgi:hypothetical protein